MYAHYNREVEVEVWVERANGSEDLLTVTAYDIQYIPPHGGYSDEPPEYGELEYLLHDAEGAPIKLTQREEKVVEEAIWKDIEKHTINWRVREDLDY